MGFGPRTGRAAGYCAGFPYPGYMNPLPGRGWGRGFGLGYRRGFGRGGGRGWGWRALGYPQYEPPYYPYDMPPYAPPTATAEDELEALKAQAVYFDNALGDIRKRIAELEKEAAESK